jgi:hypothetical protein
MREIRMFEMEYEEPAQCLRVARGLDLHVSDGELWLTIDGDAADYWLRAGESLSLARGVSVRIGAWRGGARFAIVAGGATAAEPRATALATTLIGRLTTTLASRGWTRLTWRTRAAS